MGRGTVAAIASTTHEIVGVRRAIRTLIENLDRPLEQFIHRGDQVLVKVNMACSGARHPSRRLTTHPSFVECIIEALSDCGARVSFGDDASRAGKYASGIYRATGFTDVSKRTGAAIIDFVSAGAREVSSSQIVPRSYLISNAYYDADVIINAANCRSHVGIGLSGAIKNMFGFVVGKRKQLIHNLFPRDPRRFGRAIADIHRLIPADLSFLDMTSVMEGAGIRPDVQEVGLLLAGTDPVALDTVAAHAIGYEDLPIWSTYYAHRFGIGEKEIRTLCIKGVDWPNFPRLRLRPPHITDNQKPSVYDRVSAVANNTFLRERPVINSNCTGCGECAVRCPVQSIHLTEDNRYKIDLQRCGDCGCCLKVCEEDAVKLEQVGLGMLMRRLLNRREPPLSDIPSLAAGADPAPRA
jgi:uncharacterized protein (DUF362 family)/Pyruvate/2-oxoacid:ferredoxin oxidoreductase delta subunit